MSALTSYLSSTAIQLAALPHGLWNLVSQRTMPAAPTQSDKLETGVHTALGALLGLGASTVVQTIQTKGAMALFTGSRMGLADMSWSSLGTALVTGAAIGASVGIATYLSREGRRAHRLGTERSSGSSQSNVGLQEMEQKGPDPWAINRILEKDPKAGPRIERASVVHAMAQTHATATDVHSYATVATAVAMVTRVGDFSPSVHTTKERWLKSSIDQQNGAPGGQLLLKTLANMPSPKENINALEMHSSWLSMLDEHIGSPNARASFQDAFDRWSSQHFKEKPSLAVFQTLLAQADEIRTNGNKCLQVQNELAQMQSLQASVLVGTRVSPVVSVPRNNTPEIPMQSQGPSM